MDAGAIRLSEFELRREGRDAEYDMRARAPRRRASWRASWAPRRAGRWAGLLGGLAADLLPGAGDTEVPLELTATVDSEDGRPEVTDAQGSVAGSRPGRSPRSCSARCWTGCRGPLDQGLKFA